MKEAAGAGESIKQCYDTVKGGPGIVVPDKRKPSGTAWRFWGGVESPTGFDAERGARGGLLPRARLCILSGF